MIKLGPFVHFSEINVSDDVINSKNSCIVSLSARCLVARKERTIILPARNEGVNCISVRMDRGLPYPAVIVADGCRFECRSCPTFQRVSKSVIDVVNFKSNVANAISVKLYVFRCRMLCSQPAREHECCLPLRECVGGSIPNACFQAAVSELRESECIAIVVRGLLRIAYVKFEVMNSP